MKKLIVLIQVAVLFLALSDAYSQSGWYIQNSGTTENLYDVSFTDANTGTAVGASGTIVRTTNGGTNWTSQWFVITDYFSDVSFTDENTGTVVGYSGTILRTTNGGTNWSSQTSGTTYQLTGVYFTDANTGTAVGEGGTILRTTNGGVTFINQISSEIPQRFSLYQNYPNPFNPSTSITFDIVKTSDVKLVVFDVLGREVSELVNERLSNGSFRVDFNASNLRSGVYFYKLITDEFVNVKKMVLIK